jgi:hypothetical protein
MDRSALHDLEEKNRELIAQLQQANEFVALDPTNAQFISLKQMVEDAIRVNNHAMNLLKSAETRSGESSRIVSVGIGGGAVGVNNSSAGYNDNGDKDDVDSDSGDENALADRGNGVLRIGDNVLIEGRKPDGSPRLFAAVLLEICSGKTGTGESGDNADASQDCKVKYFEYPDSDAVVVPLSTLNPIPPGFYGSLAELFVGMPCLSKFAPDGEYYDAEVKAITSRGVSVIYTKYGNVEEVPIEYIKPISNSTYTNGNKLGVGNKKGLIHIPDKLKILPTDTEEEKKRKRNRLKSLKTHNKIVTKEIELDNQKASWQNFVAKSTKKSSSNVLINKSSIFSTNKETHYTEIERRKPSNKL